MNHIENFDQNYRIFLYNDVLKNYMNYLVSQYLNSHRNKLDISFKSVSINIIVWFYADIYKIDMIVLQNESDHYESYRKF